ncbi:ATPase [Novosphingobium flavum]|uniref:ATPase n=1 Tax=Novosphingobium flavum TaxID=1778672 RepID=A0A7X1FUK4_9SPHN|nr:ATPase [Novosphingobium flavum]
MKQLPLPLSAGASPSRIVVGPANAAVVDAFARTDTWPFRTAVLAGPPRSGKSLLARWFVSSGQGEAIDDAETLDETELFHCWNRAQESGTALLIVTGAGEGGWAVTLPDLASRLGGSLHLQIGAPDEAMMAELMAVHAELRGFTLGPDATSYLVARAERSHLGVERLVEAIDRLSLERRQPPTVAIWREALEEVNGGSQPPLL